MKRKVDLRDARLSADDRRWLANVYPFYLHDLSEFDDGYYDLDEQGVWQPDHLPSWLEEDGDHPLIIGESERRAGFALVNEAPSPHVMAGIRFRLSEFFVLKKYRRGGIGRHAAARLFDQFRGTWQISVLPRNTPAIRFWERVITENAEDVRRETASDGGIVYIFETEELS